MRSAMIMVAPNGARKGKADHPALPVTPDEVAATAVKCLDAGATALHLHARDAKGRHTLDPGIYRIFIDAAEASVGGNMVIQITSESVGFYGAQEQRNVIRLLRPQAATFAVRELVPDRSHEEDAARFFRDIAAWGCSPQFIIYDETDALYFAELVDQGIIPQRRPSAIFVLGRYHPPGHKLASGDGSDPRKITKFLHDWPVLWPWALCAFGTAETTALAAAIAMGGHARLGFENNHIHADGSIAESNQDRVTCFVHLMKSLGCTPMQYDETRRLFATAAEI